MNISITKNHDIELDKKELEGIKTATEFMVFLENMAFLFTRLCNYSDKLELTQEQKRYRSNMERNLGYYLLRRSDHE
jgi:hypothetical protein